MKLVNFSAVVTLLALTSLPARSQKPAAPLPATTAAPWTRGSCSPAVTGQNDQFTIHCPGMTNEQGEKLLGIVNKILANELDPQLVLAKLDEIQRGLKPNLPVKTYFCDGMWQSIGPKADTVLDSKTGGNDFDFLNMISLFKSNQYPKLLKTCLALVHQPRVLLLDEPTRSLDAIAAMEFRRFLKKEIVQAAGTSLLFASHTLPEVELLADRVAVIDRGRLLGCDTPAALKQRTHSTTLEEMFLKLTGRSAAHIPEGPHE